ncbi:unnamed protein product [Sphacelaria rigidula]
MSSSVAHVKTTENDVDDVDNQEIHAVRIGCALYVLHIAVTAGFEGEFFTSPMGSGSWHEWGESHLVNRLGTVWDTLSGSTSST